MAEKKEKKYRVSPDTGNRTSLTDELIDEIEELFSKGLHESTVAKMLGVNPRLMHEWLVKGAVYGRGIHCELFMRCAKALGTFEVELITELQKHAFGSPAEYLVDGRGKLKLDKKGKAILVKAEVKPNPKWIVWFLERRFPKTYSKSGFSDDDDFLFNAPFNGKPPVFDNEIKLSELSNDEQMKLIMREIEALEAKSKAAT